MTSPPPAGARTPSLRSLATSSRTSSSSSNPGLRARSRSSPTREAQARASERHTEGATGPPPVSIEPRRSCS
eukprot:8931442-Alexandrium_andersonii.AAC.2